MSSSVYGQCGTSTSSVALNTQTDVNNFITTYCDNYLGKITIKDNNDGTDNIVDLTPLADLTYVGTRLTIFDNDNLTSIPDFPNLTSIGEQLQHAYCIFPINRLP